MKKSVLIGVYFSCLTLLGAQTDSLPDYPDGNDSPGRAFLDIVLELEMGFPLADFKSEMDKGMMIGKGIGVFYRLKKMPMDLGLRFGDFAYDNVRRKFTDADGIDLVQKTKNKIWVWYGAVRIEPKATHALNIYFEGALGWRRYYTKVFSKETCCSFGGGDEDNRFDKATLNSDWALVYGGAVGTKIILEKKFNSALDLQIGFKQSNPGRFYIHNGSLQVATEPIDNLIERKAEFSMLSIKLGISLLGYQMD